MKAWVWHWTYGRWRLLFARSFRRSLRSRTTSAAFAKEAIELWLDTAKAKRIPIPEPMSRKKFSGKFVVRTHEELHATMAQEALRRGKSMNELAVELLSKGLKKAG